MPILGIETSCDETACGIVDSDGQILANVVASQIETHAPYGGIIPELASRAHIVNIHKVVDQAISESNVKLTDLEAIAVTNGPGLAGSLLVGLNFAKGLSASLGIPLLGVNHLEGHVSACFIEDEKFNFSKILYYTKIWELRFQAKPLLMNLLLNKVQLLTYLI